MNRYYNNKSCNYKVKRIVNIKGELSIGWFG